MASESYPSSSLKCASCPGQVLLQISGVLCIRVAFGVCPPRASSICRPMQPWGRIHHCSSGCSSACSSPLWAVISHSPCLNFRARLRSPHGTQQQYSKQDRKDYSRLHTKTNVQEATRKNPPHCLTGRSAWGPRLPNESYPSSRLNRASSLGSDLSRSLV